MKKQDEKGSPRYEYDMQVTSTSFRTPEEGSWITDLYPDSNGYHYCKLLSPARAVEYILWAYLLEKI